MIQPAPGVAFTWSHQGDQLSDPAARRRTSAALGTESEWATARQVHGSEVRTVDSAGPAGNADGLVTDRRGLPLAIFTADCLGVVLRGERMVGVAHAGWRGLADGVLEAAIAAMAERGSSPRAAYIGPGIGPCCFEVGPEVGGLFPRQTASTTWGTLSVDLVGEARSRLSDIEVWVDGRCTMCGGGFSHRRNESPERMSALGWLP